MKTPNAPPEQRMRAYPSSAQAVPVAIRWIRDHLVTSIPCSYASYAEFGRMAFGGMAAFCETDISSVHEVMPGHYIQFVHANRSASKLASIYNGYAFAEGWAHYAEELRRDWLSARDGKTSLREFHEQLLDLGGPPVPLVRKVMLGGGRGSLFQGPGGVAYPVVAICPHLKIPYFT